MAPVLNTPRPTFSGTRALICECWISWVNAPGSPGCSGGELLISRKPLGPSSDYGETIQSYHLPTSALICKPRFRRPLAPREVPSLGARGLRSSRSSSFVFEYRRQGSLQQTAGSVLI